MKKRFKIRFTESTCNLLYFIGKEQPIIEDD